MRDKFLGNLDPIFWEEFSDFDNFLIDDLIETIRRNGKLSENDLISSSYDNGEYLPNKTRRLEKIKRVKRCQN